jgi:hypothetical protein
MIASTTPNDRYRTFEKIDEISQKLLAKGTIARFVDKGGDSNTVARLIERLREAIVCYQVSEDHTSVLSTVDTEQISQQQAIYQSITHLTVRFPHLISGIRTDYPVSQVLV